MSRREDGWTKKTRGNAKIYTHPDTFEERAVVENHWGVSFNGVMYESVFAAKQAALAHLSDAP